MRPSWPLEFAMPSGQMLRFRIQHDAGGFEARSGHDHHARAHFDFLPGVAIDVRHAARQAVLIDQNVLRERIGAQLQVAVASARGRNLNGVEKNEPVSQPVVQAPQKWHAGLPS